MIKQLKKIREEKGFMSILMVFFVASLLPLLLFYFVEMTYLNGMKDKFQGFNDAAASAAVMQMEKELIKDANITLIDQDAKEVVDRILSENLILNEDMTPAVDSFVKEAPLVKVYVVNHNNGESPSEFITDEGFVFKIKNPTVIVYSEVKPNGVFFNRFVTIKSISAYESFFKKDQEPNVSSNPIISVDGLVVTMNRVVNPLRFNHPTGTFPLDWQFSPLPMAAGGNIEVSIHSTLGDTDLIHADYVLRLNGERYKSEISRSMKKVSNNVLTDTIQLPDEVPIGSTVTLDFTTIEFENISGTQLKGNDAVGFQDEGEIIGDIETNLNKLIRFQKVYQQ
ncbi:cobalt ABC transporter permease [Brevibacillus sp. NPDC058079]|uniref:cobalt ABC transporter permease n=1 Tax=Brevibacillus sp. NPDC058079 TaxID=3346330 RepID=UPI0036ED210E